jgi:hypothetical protein
VAGAELDSGAELVVGAAGADWDELVAGAAGADWDELVAGAAGADLVELGELEEPAELEGLELPHPAATRAISTAGTAAKRGLTRRA